MLSQRKRWEFIIEESLEELARFIKEDRWFGRENEIVNLFAHKFLIDKVGKEPLIDISQIGIEVAVKQIQKPRGKKLVRKDLVVWNRPLDTVWANGIAENSPAAILEWKTNKITKCEADINWLQTYTTFYPQVLGYSVCAIMSERRGIWYKKIEKGRVGKHKLISD